MWGEYHRSGCHPDAPYSARAGAAGRWARRVDALLPRLSPQARLVLRLRYVEGLSYARARDDLRVTLSERAWSDERRRAEMWLARWLLAE